MVRSYRPSREKRRGRRRQTLKADHEYHVAIYARISTGEGMQAEGHSIEAQLRICREFAERRGWVVVDEYVDEGWSGTTDERPAFQRMLDDAFADHFQVIVFHKLDRFSRSISDVLHYFNELESNDILMASATEAFDFSDPADRAKFHMLAVFAQWYIDNLSAETKKGKKQRALKGLYNGRLPFGYVKSEDGIAQIVPEEAALIRRAYEAYATGTQSYRDVAELMNQSGIRTRTGRGWSKDSVRDFLQNEFYLGYVKYLGKLIPGKHEAVISQDLFDRCQEMRQKRYRAPRSHARTFRTYVLGGLLYCDRCEMSLRCSPVREYRYYRERSNARGLKCEDSGETVRAEIPEEQIGVILRQIRLPQDWQEYIREMQLSADERQRLLDRQKYLEEKLSRLGLSFADGVISEETYAEERDLAQEELASIVIPEDVSVVDAGLYLETLQAIWDHATLKEQKEVCTLVLDAVYYDIRKQRITRLVPRPAFQPLFRGIPGLSETETGRFEVSPVLRHETVAK